MSIVIKTEKVVERGVAKRRILEIQALNNHELPEEYSLGIPRCWIWSGSKKFYFAGEANVSGNIPPGTIIPEKDFQANVLTAVKEAGARLKEINDRIRELEKTWNGEETFII